jgi:hypothetical protein
MDVADDHYDKRDHQQSKNSSHPAHPCAQRFFPVQHSREKNLSECVKHVADDCGMAILRATQAFPDTTRRMSFQTREAVNLGYQHSPPNLISNV